MGLASAALALWVLVWLLVWLLVAVLVVRRQDLGIGGKAAWILVIMLAPVMRLLASFLWGAFRGQSR